MRGISAISPFHMTAHFSTHYRASSSDHVIAHARALSDARVPPDAFVLRPAWRCRYAIHRCSARSAQRGTPAFSARGPAARERRDSSREPMPIYHHLIAGRRRRVAPSRTYRRRRASVMRECSGHAGDAIIDGKSLVLAITPGCPQRSMGAG